MALMLHHSNCCRPWVSYQIRKIAGCACAGNGGNVYSRRRLQRKPLVSDPGMHHCRDACRDRLSAKAEKMFPAFPAHMRRQFYVSDKRSMEVGWCGGRVVIGGKSQQKIFGCGLYHLSYNRHAILDSPKNF